MFNNSNPKTNGEEFFFKKIQNKIKVIFDVGCRVDSEFVEFKGKVHYFEPVKEFIENIKTQKNKNKKSYFNNFGLGEENKEIFYYPQHQSFCNRNKDNSQEKVLLKIKKGKDYVNEKNIKRIDFLKIDTEGYELNVLLGFEDFLKNINVIQFEYGGTFKDNNIKLVDVINLLKKMGFEKFSYLVKDGVVPLTNYEDHYMYCNIVCLNRKSKIKF